MSEIPRWRLTASHYINVPGTKYVREEQDRDTGETARVEYDVPTFLDIRNPPRRYYQDGNIIVTTVAGGNPRDVVFKGPPTPDMEPLNDAAAAISKAQHWQNPMGEEAFPTSGGNGYGGSEGFGAAMIASFEKAMNELTKSGGAVSTKGVDPERLSALEEQMQKLIEQNARLQEQLEAKPAKTARRA